MNETIITKTSLTKAEKKLLKTGYVITMDAIDGPVHEWWATVLENTQGINRIASPKLRAILAHRIYSTGFDAPEKTSSYLSRFSATHIVENEDKWHVVFPDEQHYFYFLLAVK